MTKRLILNFEYKGLTVYGDTWLAKDTLKECGGRWDPLRHTWVLPHSTKAELLTALKSTPDFASFAIDDRAKVNLALCNCDRGLLVTGDTFPVKEVLKTAGGTWDPALQGWVFKETIEKSHVLSFLRGSADIAKVDDKANASDATSKSRVLAIANVHKAPLPVRDVKQLRSEPLPIRDKPSRGEAIVALKGASASNARENLSVVAERPDGRATGKKKVVETLKKQQTVKTRRDGSKVIVETELKRRVISDAKSPRAKKAKNSSVSSKPRKATKSTTKKVPMKSVVKKLKKETPGARARSSKKKR